MIFFVSFSLRYKIGIERHLIYPLNVDGIIARRGTSIFKNSMAVTKLNIIEKLFQVFQRQSIASKTFSV